MDVLELIAKSEWPLVVGGGLYLFREPISALLRGLRPTKASGLGFSFEFSESLLKAEELTDSTTPIVPPATLTLPKAPTGNAADAPKLSPTMAFDEALPGSLPSRRVHIPEGLVPEIEVLRAYGRLEETLKKFQHELVGRHKLTQWPDVEEMAKNLGLDGNDIAALRELRMLRDKVAHAMVGELYWNDAFRFIAVADRLIGRVKLLWDERIKQYNEERTSSS